jgi:high-affinity K+ transport system ATPase subunit B
MIYDMASNTMFETADVTVKIVADETGVERFLADAKDKVKTKTYTYKEIQRRTRRRRPQRQPS